MDGTWTGAGVLAEALMAAHRQQHHRSAEGLAVPPSLAAAGEVQELVTRALAAPVSGWKVGVGPDGEAVAAPMRPVLEDNGDILLPWQPRSGVEVELCFRFGADLAVNPAAATAESLLERVEAVHLGIEITGGRLAEGNRAPYRLFLADSLDNAGYVIGPAVPKSLVASVIAGEVPLTVSGATTWEGPAVHPQGHPLAPLAGVLRGGLWARCGADGSIVTTGSFCGLLPVRAPGTVSVGFGTGYAMRVTFA